MEKAGFIVILPRYLPLRASYFLPRFRLISSTCIITGLQSPIFARDVCSSNVNTIIGESLFDYTNYLVKYWPLSMEDNSLMC